MYSEKDPLHLMQDVIFLKNNPVFKDVKTLELKEIAAIAYDKKFSANEKIVTEGEPGDSLFLVRSGSIRITKTLASDEITLAVLPPGSIFGEMVLFEDLTRSASALADADSVLLIIEKSELMEVIKLYPGIAIQLFKVLGSRLRSANDKVRELTEALEKQS